MYGARPLKRYLQKNVETLAAKPILAGNVGRGDRIEIDVVDGKLEAKSERTDRRMTPVIFHIDVNSAYLSWTAVEQLKKWCRNRFAYDPVDHRRRSEIPSWGCSRKVNSGKRYGIRTGEPVANAFVSVRIW